MSWVSLNTRRKEQKLAFMYKAVNDLTPDNISDLIPHLVRDTTNYPLRNNYNPAVPFTRTEILRKSCIPSSISLWNSLHVEICTSSGLLCFKSKLKHLRSDFNNVPHFFLCGERYWSVMQARIRNNCSNLKNDLYLNHLFNSPTCGSGFIMLSTFSSIVQTTRTSVLYYLTKSEITSL